MGITSQKIMPKPLLYYRTREDIEAYRKKPVKEKLRWLEAQMEFFTRLCQRGLMRLEVS